VNWLTLPPEKRPHLITFYFFDVDNLSHTYGPDAPQTRKAVGFIDSAVNELNKAVKKTGLDVNFIFLSDHGMTKVDQKNLIPMPAAADTTKFIIKGDGFIAELYAKTDTTDIKPAYEKMKAEAKDFDVYLKSNAPKRWHRAVKDDWHKRVGDIMLVPHWPQLINLNYKKISPGQHGYDPYLVKDMHAIFYAWGPAFKSHLTIPAFENVNVYPIVTELLNLKQTEKIDGTSKVAKQILKAKNITKAKISR
jgi:predicted AlkP superfamily pyrophosphatase or phosphodiesterase